MEAQKYCVYNLSRRSFLGLEVAAVDTTVASLRKLVESLFARAETGVWLTPYRGIPPAAGLAPFDLVGIDESYRVIDQIRSVSTSNLAPMKAGAASALVLPAGTILASHTEPGDELAICLPEEMEQSLEGLLGFSASTLAAQSAEFRAGSLPVDGASAATRTTDHRQRKMATQRLHESDEIEVGGSLKARIRRWFKPDRREGKRYPTHGLVAYQWAGNSPQAHSIGDISISGLYLLTPDRRVYGTRMLMRLQRSDTDGADPEDSIAVRTEVVRWGSDGEGLAFVLSGLKDPRRDETMPESAASKWELKKFLQQLKLEERQEHASL